MSEQELWKDITDYEGIYQVSTHGRIKTLSIWHKNRYGGYYTEERIRKQHLSDDGYWLVTLCKESKLKSFLVHRLVAETFITNPMNYPQVNHKDENKLNNHVTNLEWCSSIYNATYGSMQERAKKNDVKRLSSFR